MLANCAFVIAVALIPVVEDTKLKAAAVSLALHLHQY